MNIRELYSFLRFLQELREEHETKRTVTTDDLIALHNIEEMIVETKRKIRKLQHQRPVDPDFVLEHRIVRQYDGDGCVELILIDHSFGDQSDIRHYADDQIWIEARPSMYDCTGQHFSRWYSIFRTPRGWRIYHSIGIDV